MVIATTPNTVQKYVAQAALMGPAPAPGADRPFLEEATEVECPMPLARRANQGVVIRRKSMEHIGRSRRALPAIPPHVLPSRQLNLRHFLRHYSRFTLSCLCRGAESPSALMTVQYAHPA